MVTYAYDYSFLIKTLKYIFLPILAVVVIVGFIVFMYSKKSKKDNIEKHNYVIDLWTTLLAITVIGALFAVTLGFSLSLTKTIKDYDLITGHEIIYYLVLATPAVPLVFLCIYIYKFIVTLYNKPSKEENKVVNEKPIIQEEIEENNVDDYHIDFTKFNEETEKVEEQEKEEIEENYDEKNEETSDDEDVINIDDLPDKVIEENNDDIELL